MLSLEVTFKIVDILKANNNYNLQDDKHSNNHIGVLFAHV